jgi:PAS domain S-box-containing protein
MDINGRQEQFRYAHRMIKPSGEVVYVIHYVESTVDENGNLVQVYGITKDITERKLVEEKLRISEQKLTTILESIGDCFYAVDRNWTVTYWNRKTEEVMNKSRKEILGKNFWDIYPPATKLKFFEAYHEAMRSGKVVQFEEYVHPLNRWLEVSAYPSAEGLSVYFKDITARKNDQEELKKSNARYSLVSKATSDAIWDWDLQVNEIYWGEGFETIFGYPLCELLCGMSAWTENIHPDDRARVVQSLERLFDGSDIHWSDEYRFRKKGGQYAIVSDRGFVIRDENGKAVRMVGALQDITHQKEAESALRLSEERFKLLFFESPKPKWMFDEQSLRIVEVNKAATDLYGYSREEFLQLTIADLKLRDDVPELLSLRKQGITQYHNLVRHRKKNGDVFPIEISSHAIALPNGRHFIVVGEDMTQRLKLQQMVVDEKIAAQKEVARAIIVTQERERSEIAKELHDNVNQLLTTAKLYVENIDCFPEQRPEFLKKSVCLLQRSISEIRLLSKQLVTPVINDIGFKATVDELLHHYSSLRLFEIELNYDLEEENLDKGLQLTIYRIIQEQLNNIVKYAKASRVTIAVTQEGDKLGVMIRDNGIGFDTTNVVKGLGLNNMKNRAEVFKGKIRISSKTGAGTEVVVAFPYRVRRRA